jgi:hypothetical protein
MARSGFCLIRSECDHLGRLRDDNSGEKHHLLPVPAVFVVACSGIIQSSYVNPDYKVRLHPDLLLASPSVGSEVTVGLHHEPIHVASSVPLVLFAAWNASGLSIRSG